MEKKFPIFKILTLLVWLVLGMGTAFAAAPKCAANTTWGGFKTVIATQNADGVYEIDSPEKLAWFACEVTSYGTGTAGQSVKLNAILTQSIDLQGKLFIPIAAGKGTPSYGGIFDGQGFTIKNLFIDASEIVKSTNGGDAKYAQNIGLFAALKGGTIKNVTLTNVEIYAASSAGDAGTNGADNPISVGAVAGYLESGTITGCAVSGKIETSGSVNRVGGIAGNVWAATISDCISEADVIATGNNTHVGGILGAVRKDGDVTINSCVYAGETLFSDNGSVGAVVGNYEKNKDITTNDLYYSADYSAVGTGLGNRPFNSTQVDDLNTENVICELNGGSWNTNEGTCSNASPNGTWSEGQSNISINGSDGFKVTFDANGGAFPEGAKTSKFFAKGATITANEIENPTYTGYKFAGWSLTQGGDAVQNLGKADKAKTVYAVWKPIHTITFKTVPGTFVGGSSEESKNVAEGDVVTVEGLPALPVRFCSQETNGNCDKYAYFNGWSTVSHAPYGENETIPEGTIVDLPTFEFSDDVTLYAVWIESETYTVTFNANQHGQTKVAFVKVGKNEKTVQPPDPDANEGYVFTGRWCEEIPCDDNTKFKFNTEIKRNYVLYADWSVPDYNITYMINGVANTTTGNPATYNVEDATITLKKPENAGDEFKGWFDENGNEATTIPSGSTGNKTFYATWKYTITYLADNTLSATTPSDEKEHGVAKELKGATFVHGGCTQDGWSKVSYGKEGYNLDYAVSGTYTENNDVILFPHWNCGKYNITYEVYGMSVTNRNPGDYTGPAKITLENAFDPAKKYFFMDNWYKESTFKTVIRDIQNIDADLTLYARWYNKITYMPGNNVSGAKNLEEKKYFDKTYTFKSSIDKYVRTNYTLDGWSTTDGGDKVYELGGKYNTNENLTLYPHWVENRNCVSYGAAVNVCTYATDGRVEAIIDGVYGANENENLLAVDIPAGGIEVSHVEMTRKFPTGNLAYSTFVLPFDVNTENISNVRAVLRYNGLKNNRSTISMKVVWATPEWVAANNIKENDQLKVYENTTLNANTPYMVLMGGDGKFVVNGGVTLKETTSAYTLKDGWVFRGTWQYKMWGAKGTDPETGLAYGFSARDAAGISVGDFVKVGAGAWIPPMRAYLVSESVSPVSSQIRANGAYVKRPTVKPEELPEIMSVVIDGIGDGNETTVIGQFNTRTGVFKMNYDRGKFDLKGRRVNGSNNARGAYYGKKILKK